MLTTIKAQSYSMNSAPQTPRTHSDLAPNGDIDIYYESTGSGEALVFGHGFTLDRRMWHHQVEYFSERYQCVTLDFRGHGKSGVPVTGYSRDHRETDITAVVDHLGIDKFNLIGLSMGGATAIGFAIDYPARLKSLILVSAGPTKFNPTRTQDSLTKLAKEQGVEVAKQRWMDSVLRYYDKHPRPEADLMRQMMLDHSGGPWKDPNRGGYTHRNDIELLSDMHVPTLILVGARDISFVPMANTLHEAIPNSTLDVVSGVGHMLNLEAPDYFNKRLEKWLAEQK